MTVPEVVGATLAQQRRAGSIFTAAWEEALREGLHASNDLERGRWRHALAETRAAWEAAYLREEPSGKVAAVWRLFTPDDEERCA